MCLNPVDSRDVMHLLGEDIGVTFCKNTGVILIPQLDHIPTERERKLWLEESKLWHDDQQCEHGPAGQNGKLAYASTDGLFDNYTDTIPKDFDHSEFPCFMSAEESPFGVALCKESGRLIPHSRIKDPSLLVLRCSTYEDGDGVHSATNKIGILHHLQHAQSRIEEKMLMSSSVIMTPTETFETDAPVTDDQREQGIRGWRELRNPSDEDQSILLPVYDDAIFSEDELKKIPRAGDQDHPEDYFDYDGILYPLAVSMVMLRDSPMLWGPAGTGKTSAYKHLAYIMNLPFERISITPSTEVDELFGRTEFEEGRGTYYRPGRLVEAWKKPNVILLDEPNSAQPDVWFLLRPLLDSDKQLALDASQGEIIDRHPHTYLGLAANPAWDTKNSGVNPLADADMSRLLHVSISNPSLEIERKIIMSRCKKLGIEITPRQIDSMERIAGQIRTMCNEGALQFSWGTRSQLQVARLLPYFTMAQAYEAAMGASLEPEQRDAFMSAIQTYLD